MKQPPPSTVAKKSTSKHKEFNSGKKATKIAAIKKTKSFSEEWGTSKVINFCHKLIKCISESRYNNSIHFNKNQH